MIISTDLYGLCQSIQPKSPSSLHHSSLELHGFMDRFPDSPTPESATGSKNIQHFTIMQCTNYETLKSMEISKIITYNFLKERGEQDSILVPHFHEYQFLLTHK